jgi:hypothetical protein
MQVPGYELRVAVSEMQVTLCAMLHALCMFRRCCCYAVLRSFSNAKAIEQRVNEVMRL